MFHRVSPEKARNLQSSAADSLPSDTTAEEPLQRDDTAAESLPSHTTAEESLQSKSPAFLPLQDNHAAAEQTKANGASKTNGDSTSNRTSNTNGASISNGASYTVKSTTRTEFEAVFPSIVEDLIEHCKRYNSPDNAVNWFRTVRASCLFPC